MTLARARLSRFFIGWIFENMSFAIPVRRLRETGSLIAFRHPKPSYEIHILIVPKKSLSGLEALSPEDDGFYIDLFTIVQSLVEELDLVERGYRLVVNGGSFQDIPQLHFHLISGISNTSDRVPG